MTRRANSSERATPTIKDVAAHAAVSTATVSHVVNATGRASAKTREKVLQAIQELGFRPNGNAASLRSRRSRIIGLVVPSITNAFFAQMASEFETLAMSGGYDIAIVTSNEDREREHERILALLSRQIDGLIIYPCSDDAVGRGLDAPTLPPTVLMDRGLAIPGFDSVGLRNEDGGHAVAKYLIELGHRDIAVIVPNLELAASSDRVKGVERALAQLPGPQSLRVVLGGHSIEGSRSAIEQELRREDRPTAVLAATNVATLGAIKAIQALQLDMPNDVSLVGFDDFEWMTALRPFVSAVSQPTRQLASHAWEILLDRMNPGMNANQALPRQHITLGGEFRIRESSGRVMQKTGARHQPLR
jgi:LacI family transcriptional regulator